MQPFVSFTLFRQPHRAAAAYTRIQPAAVAAVVCGPGALGWSHAAAEADAGLSLSWPVIELVTIALFLLCGWAIVTVLRKRVRALSGASEAVRVVGGAALGTRERAVIVRAHGRLFLLGVTPHAVSLIAELQHEPSAAEPAAEPTAMPAAAGVDDDAPASSVR
jgi:flagellar protein FliO/FliZ